MKKSISIAFNAQEHHQQIDIRDELNYETFIAMIETVKKKLQKDYNTKNMKVFLKQQLPNQKYFKFINWLKQKDVEDYLSIKSNPINVQFFYQNKEETFKKVILKIGNFLEQKEKYLGKLTNQLKDEVNQLYASQFIRRKTSKDEQTIQVFLIVSDPLVQLEKDIHKNVVYNPLYHHQIDIPNHIERLRKASLSNADLTIKAKRVIGRKQDIIRCLRYGNNGNQDKRMFTIVQFFTRVQKHNGKLMISLQQKNEQIGQRVWIEAEQLLKEQICSDIIIFIGVGVNLLKKFSQQHNFGHCLILISTISIEDKPMLTQTQDRNFLDVENSYHDKYCQTFLEEFYSNIFKRINVRESYRIAQQQAQKHINKNIWCCCLHEHDPNCNWHIVARRIGEPQIHRLQKHSLQFWNVTNYFQDRRKLQVLLLNQREEMNSNGSIIRVKPPPCGIQSTCCHEKLGLSRKDIHTLNLKEIIIWNKKQSQEMYTHLEQQCERPNRFQSQTYDKPAGRRRPLTIFKLVEHINKNQISIIRSPIISTLKRDFGIARQYMVSRLPSIRFYEFENSSYQIRKKKFKQQLRQYIIEQRGHLSKIGASIKSRGFSLYIYLLHNQSKGDRYYQKILDEYRQLTFQFTKIKFKLILLIKNVNFSNLTLNLFNPNKTELLYSDRKSQINLKEINLTKSVSLSINSINNKTKMNISYEIEDQPQLLQRYYDILSRHSFASIVNNFPLITRKIQYGQLIDENIRQTTVQQLRNNRFNSAYLFIGFLNQFTDDGFYLNEVNRIILSKIFSLDILQDALNGKLPVQHINLPGCIYIQLHKAYREHFKNPENSFKLLFQQKKLQFYYMLMRLYFQFWPQSEVVNYPGVIRQYINKQGIFSIDIEKENANYDDLIQQCKNQIKQKKQTINEILFNIENNIHIYHLNQVQKILQQFLKKKKNKHNPTTSKSYVNPSQLGLFQYLLWNIVHKTWLMGLILSRHYQQEVKHFQIIILIFLVQIQILLPVSEIARVQIHVLMHKYPPKREEINFAPLTQFLKFYRNYAYQDMVLADLVPQWGNHCKFNDLFGTCCKLVSLISQSIDQNDNINNLTPECRQKYEKFKDHLKYKHKMFNGTNSNKWALQSLKLVERKILYYFSFSNQFKKNQSLLEYQEKLLFFQKYFKLKWIEYQFNNFLHKLPEQMRKKENTILIQLYLNVQLNQPQEEAKQLQKLQNQMKLLKDLKGKISPEYLPIFNYLCQKFEQKTMFNVNGLIIFARARNLICDDKPYAFTRKRTLLTEYLGKVFKNKSLKISYFFLTEQTLKIFEVNKNNNKCEVLCMIMTVDAINSNELLFESEEGVKAVKMSVQKFAQKLNNCRIKILILCGKNSTKICERLKQIKQNYALYGHPSLSTSIIQQNSDQINQVASSSIIKSKIGAGSSMLRSKINSIVSTQFPSIIAIQSKCYSLSDANIYQYKQQSQSQQKIIHSQKKQVNLFSRPKLSFEEDSKQEDISEDSIQENVIDKLLEQQSLKQDKIMINLADASGRNVLPTAILKRAESAESIDLHNGVQQYLRNQVNSIAMDLIILAIVKNITNKLSQRDRTFDNQGLESIVLQSKKTVKKVLSNRFQCAQQVFQYIDFSVWSNNSKVSKISRGIYQDLTKRFYCSQSNLHDEDYYQNIGNCFQIGKMLDAIKIKKINCIEIFGDTRSGKSSLLQQICWICQSKNLFRFGIIKVNLNDPNFDKITERVYKQRTNKKNDTGVLIAIDDVNELKPSHRQILKKLGGKSITIIYTTSIKQSGEELRKLVQVTEYESINLDTRQQQQINNQVYASLLSHIKEKNQFMFTQEFCKNYQSKVNQIMKTVKDQQKINRLKSALDLLRVANPKLQQEKCAQFLHFYKQNFQQLLVSMEHNRQIKIKFV